MIFPLTVSGGQTVYLSDVAKVYGARMMESIAHCHKAENGLPEDIVALTVSKQQRTPPPLLNVSKMKAGGGMKHLPRIQACRLL